MERTVVIDGVEYVPRDSVVTDETMSKLAQAYGLAWSNSVYDPPCGCSLTKRILREITDCLCDANKSLHFKK